VVQWRGACRERLWLWMSVMGSETAEQEHYPEAREAIVLVQRRLRVKEFGSISW